MAETTVMGSTPSLMDLATPPDLRPLVAGHAALGLILVLQVYLGAFK